MLSAILSISSNGNLASIAYIVTASVLADITVIDIITTIIFIKFPSLNDDMRMIYIRKINFTI